MAQTPHEAPPPGSDTSSLPQATKARSLEERAEAALRRSKSWFRSTRQWQGEAAHLFSEAAKSWRWPKDWESCVRCLRRAAEMFAEIGEDIMALESLQDAAKTQEKVDLVVAANMWREVQRRWENAGNLFRAGKAARNAATAAEEATGNEELALSLWQAAAHLFEVDDSIVDACKAKERAADLCFVMGRYDEARPIYQTIIKYYRPDHLLCWELKRIIVKVFLLMLNQEIRDKASRCGVSEQDGEDRWEGLHRFLVEKVETSSEFIFCQKVLLAVRQADLESFSVVVRNEDPFERIRMEPSILRMLEPVRRFIAASSQSNVPAANHASGAGGSGHASRAEGEPEPVSDRQEDIKEATEASATVNPFEAPDLL